MKVSIITPPPFTKAIDGWCFLVAQAEAQQELDTLRIIENSLNTVCREQKEVFMAAYQRFVQTLQDALAPFPPHERDTQLTWNYRWIFGWYRESMRKVGKRG